MTQVNTDFAAEIRSDRLRILWRVTLGAAALATYGVITVGLLNKDIPWAATMPFVILMAFSLFTRGQLNQKRYLPAVLAYVFGAIAALCAGMLVGDEVVRNTLPFVFSVLVFLVGLLLTPGQTILITVLSALLILFVPFLRFGTLEYVTLYQIGGIGLTLVSALLALQVTGDLYEITQWAVHNYQRERRTSDELFENRQQLERALNRSEALSASLREANAQLEAARQAADEAKHYRGQFLANMSHELRTPLNAIIGFSETMLKFPMMYDDVSLPAAYEADLQQIHGSARQLLTLINDILDLSKVDAGKLEIVMEPIDLRAALLHTSATAQGLLAGRPVQLVIDLPEQLPTVYADRARVSQVLLNLYSNAAKFTERGAITLRAHDHGEYVQVSVSDTGSGIHAHNLEVIFEEFKQAEVGRRDPRSGAGLGLAISRQLMHLMGGHIWAESVYGEGSTFHFTLQTTVPRGLDTQHDPEAEGAYALAQQPADAHTIVA